MVTADIDNSDKTFPRIYNYGYKCGTLSIIWREYHFDTHPYLQQYTDGDNKQYDGKLSV